VPFIIRQQVQPHFIMVAQQSQQAWIMSQQALSPEVQVTQQPSFVISTLHIPIVRLQVQQTIPFITQHIEHMPPASIWHKFCTMAQAVASSHLQVTFIPPWHFSTLNVQRGTIIMFAGIIAPADPVIGPIPVIRSAIGVTVVIMGLSLSRLTDWPRPNVVAGPPRGMIADPRRTVTPFRQRGCGSVK
jgi:hypothetical protein